MTISRIYAWFQIHLGKPLFPLPLPWERDYNPDIKLKTTCISSQILGEKLFLPLLRVLTYNLDHAPSPVQVSILGTLFLCDFLRKNTWYMQKHMVYAKFKNLINQWVHQYMSITT